VIVQARKGEIPDLFLLVVAFKALGRDLDDEDARLLSEPGNLPGKREQRLGPGKRLRASTGVGPRLRRLFSLDERSVEVEFRQIADGRSSPSPAWHRPLPAWKRRATFGERG
jgi:hypothetical protein